MSSSEKLQPRASVSHFIKARKSHCATALSADVTSWRDGGGRALAPTLSGEGAVEGGAGGALVMDGAAGVPPPNSQPHGPPRNPPAGSPALPLPQPPVGPGFPQYRGIMPPFVSFSYQTKFVYSLSVHMQQILTGFIFSLLLKDVPSLLALPGPLWPSGALQVPGTWGRACSKVCSSPKNELKS